MQSNGTEQRWPSEVMTSGQGSRQDPSRNVGCLYPVVSVQNSWVLPRRTVDDGLDDGLDDERNGKG